MMRGKSLYLEEIKRLKETMSFKSVKAIGNPEEKGTFKEVTWIKLNPTQIE